MLRLRAHDADELSHYSTGTSDVEFMFPWGWDELEGIAQRTDYDLTQHSIHSGEKLDYFDQATNERYKPFVIEPAVGVTRLFAIFLLAAYDEDVVNDETRTVLRLHPRLAPYKIAVLPLSKKDTLTPLAHKVRKSLSEHYMVDYDETQAIGRRYRRQDEVGTPLCVTIDFDSLDDDAVTIRDRDTTEQVRVPIDSLLGEVRSRSDCGHLSRRDPRTPSCTRRVRPAFDRVVDVGRIGRAADAWVRSLASCRARPRGDRRDQASFTVERRPVRKARSGSRRRGVRARRGQLPVGAHRR
jgi:glycyl-tRNA synthetase (class II)